MAAFLTAAGEKLLVDLANEAHRKTLSQDNYVLCNPEAFVITNDDLKANWKKLGVEINGTVVRLDERAMICWGWDEEWGGLIFDTGGPQGAPCYIWRTENNNLISVGPDNQSEVIGPLVPVEDLDVQVDQDPRV